MQCALLQPRELDDALAARQQYGADSLPIAGGQSLLVMLRNRLVSPKVLIDLEPLKELRGLEPKSDGISIGAMTTFHTLLSSAEIKERVPSLAQAAALVSSTLILSQLLLEVA